MRISICSTYTHLAKGWKFKIFINKTRLISRHKIPHPIWHNFTPIETKRMFHRNEYRNEKKRKIVLKLVEPRGFRWSMGIEFPRASNQFYAKVRHQYNICSASFSDPHTCRHFLIFSSRHWLIKWFFISSTFSLHKFLCCAALYLYVKTVFPCVFPKQTIFTVRACHSVAQLTQLIRAPLYTLCAHSQCNCKPNVNHVATGKVVAPFNSVSILHPRVSVGWNFTCAHARIRGSQIHKLIKKF